MSKAWRNPRQTTVHRAPAEPEDTRRVDRLVALLASGMERLLTWQGEDAPESVDFQADVSPNTCTAEEASKSEAIP